MKTNDIILNAKLEPYQDNEFDLEQYLPLGRIDHDQVDKIEYYHISTWKRLDNTRNFNNVTARYIRFYTKKPETVTVYLGIGYVAEKDETWRKPFNRFSGWTGSDGIFSFNLKNGVDGYDQQDAKTAFVFGDTLISNSDPKTKKRFKPVLMPANTVAYMDGNGSRHKNIDFRINTNHKQHIKAFFEPQNDLAYSGTTAQNLVNHTKDVHQCYLSGYNPDVVELIFDINQTQHISAIDIFNYRPEEPFDAYILNRGFNQVDVSVSLDQEKWFKIGRFTVDKANTSESFTHINIHKTCRYVKLHVPAKQGVGNHYEASDASEVIFGANKVVFYNHKHQLQDITVFATSELSKEFINSWFWLQDGVVLGSYIYFLPMIVRPDLNKPEGLQFALEGVSLIKAPIKNGEIDFDQHSQKPTPLYRYKKDEEWVFGAAILNFSHESGYQNSDGYVYIYGYQTIKGHRTLKVARVLPDTFEYIDTWEYYANNHWSTRLEDATSILEHISCEMSVTPIETGKNKGKFIAVFQYNVDSQYVAYAIGDTPSGPFSEPRIVYTCEEPKTLGRSAYTYNAKAHPHLSKPDDILVSYNVNSYEMEHHYDNVEVYHPRFIRLKDISVSDEDKEA